MTQVRYVILVLAIIVSPFSSCLFRVLTILQISLHYILSFAHEGYGNATSFSHLKEQIIGSNGPPYKTPVPDEYYVGDEKPVSPQGRRAPAAIVMLGRPKPLE